MKLFFIITIIYPYKSIAIMYAFRFDTYFQVFVFSTILSMYIINLINKYLRIYIKITPELKLITICDISGYTGKKQLAIQIKNYYPRNKYIVCDIDNNPTQNYISTSKYIDVNDETLSNSDIVIFLKQPLIISFIKALSLGLFDFIFNRMPLEYVGKRLDTIIKNHHDFNKKEIQNPNVKIINWPYYVIVNPFMMED